MSNKNQAIIHRIKDKAPAKHHSHSPFPRVKRIAKSNSNCTNYKSKYHVYMKHKWLKAQVIRCMGSK